MDAKVVEINPFASLNWLFTLASKFLKSKVKLVLDGQ